MKKVPLKSNYHWFEKFENLSGFVNEHLARFYLYIYIHLILVIL